jgi:hypothetical protein
VTVAAGGHLFLEHQYASQFNITAVVDRGRCPDVDVFVDGLQGSLDRLGAVRQAAA